MATSESLADWNGCDVYCCRLPIHCFHHFQVEVKTAADCKDTEGEQQKLPSLKGNLENEKFAQKPGCERNTGE